jgi:flavin reductase (DIM6/NTAB) family NADH-FMN oxidoreductase RutF
LFTRKWIVNFLGEDCGELSRRFASKDVDKFSSVAWQHGKNGMPLLSSAAIAHAECTTVDEIEAGDHVIILGRVESGQGLNADRQPLTYFRGCYGSLQSPLT